MQQSEIIPPPIANGVDDAARRLAIGRTAIYELIKTGQLRTIKVGARTLIPESELQAFVAKRLSM